jgi:hypothetical protein
VLVLVLVLVRVWALGQIVREGSSAAVQGQIATAVWRTLQSLQNIQACLACSACEVVLVISEEVVVRLLRRHYFVQMEVRIGVCRMAG